MILINLKNRLARFLMAVVVLTTAVSCTDADEFSRKPFEEARVFAGNYQEIYARTLIGARRCLSPGLQIGTLSSSSLDAQLYGELGYGEIFSYDTSLTLQPTLLIRIERNGSQSKVSVKTNGLMGSGSLRSVAYKWANGYTGCKG